MVHSDEDFIAGFENCTLSNAEFHHADHVRMAFLYLQRYPPLEALERFSAGLMKFATANGKPQLYHETITWAYLLLIRDRLARAGAPRSWEEFAAANQDLMDWKNNILKKYYSAETLASDLAKKIFLFPEICQSK